MILLYLFLLKFKKTLKISNFQNIYAIKPKEVTILFNMLNFLSPLFNYFMLFGQVYVK